MSNPPVSTPPPLKRAGRPPLPSRLAIPNPGSPAGSLSSRPTSLSISTNKSTISLSNLTISTSNVASASKVTSPAALTDDIRRVIGPRARPPCNSVSSKSAGPALPLSVHNISSLSLKSPDGRKIAQGESEPADVANQVENFEIIPDDIIDMGKIGEGAGGTVRKIKHKTTGLIMAKKTIPTSPNPEIHRQILRELSFNRSCNSPYIVEYYGAFLEENDTTIAICMELCQGGSLDAIYRRIKQRNGRTGEKVLGKIAESVLHGLVYLHDRKIIHRDIKPSNILLTKDGLVKLCDFGVSGELVDSHAGTFTGTSYYMAPERIQGREYTVTSDVWSLGLTIMEIAQNRFPFPAEGEAPLAPFELLTYIVNMATPELSKEDDSVKWSDGLRQFLRQCLEKDPDKRPTPNQLLLDPFIQASSKRKVDLKRWVREVWEWDS